MALLIGIDVGTSATKVVVCDAGGKIVSVASEAHAISQPRPGWSEQDPRDWWRATVAAVRKTCDAAAVKPGEVTGVGLSGQMHGSVFLDKAALTGDGREAEPLRPALLWNDQRTSDQC